MFDIGFWELSLIAVVALVVIGPERMPSVARTVGRWAGTAKRLVHSVQTDINTEVSKVDELKSLMEEHTKIQSMHDILEQPPHDADKHKLPTDTESDYQATAMPDTNPPDLAIDETKPASTDAVNVKGNG